MTKWERLWEDFPRSPAKSRRFAGALEHVADIGVFLFYRGFYGIRVLTNSEEKKERPQGSSPRLSGQPPVLQ